MSIDITHRTEADGGILPVKFHQTFADIQLSPGNFLTVHSAADCDRLLLALITAKTRLLGETSAPMTVPLASLRDRGHYDAGSAAEGVGRCEACGTELEEGWCLWCQPRKVPEGVEPFPHFPHLPQHTNGSRVCGLCGIDHDAAARLAPPAAYQLPSASITVDGA